MSLLRSRPLAPCNRQKKTERVSEKPRALRLVYLLINYNSRFLVCDERERSDKLRPVTEPLAIASGLMLKVLPASLKIGSVLIVRVNGGSKKKGLGGGKKKGLTFLWCRHIVRALFEVTAIPRACVSRKLASS